MTRRLAAAALFAVCATPAWAAGGAGAPTLPASQLQVAMTVYAGGITMGSMDMDATIRGDDYHVVSNLQPQGVVNAFWQSEIQATSSGKVAAKNFAPALYDSANAPRLYADPAYSTTGFDVKPGDTRNTLDPLGALTMIASGVAARDGNPCTFTAPVFDGRCRYNVEMTKVRDVEIKMDNGLYQGNAAQCDIRYRQIASFPSAVAGHHYNRAAQGRDRDQIWGDGGPGHHGEGGWAKPQRRTPGIINPRLSGNILIRVRNGVGLA